MAKELCLTPGDPDGVETRAEKACVRESAETIFKNLMALNRIQKCGFEEKRLLSVANARQGWYRMATIRDINFLLNPTILGKKTKSRPGLADPLAYYLS